MAADCHLNVASGHCQLNISARRWVLGSIVENIKTVNSAVRTLLLAILVAAVGYAGFLVYSEYTKRDRLVREKDQEILKAQEQLTSLRDELNVRVAEVDQLSADLKQKQQQLERLEMAMHLLKTDQRLAQLRVLDIERDEQGEATNVKLEFIELSPNGTALSAPRPIELPGDVIYLDNWIVKFDDSYIEKGDVQRGTSLCLFRRVFSENQVPTKGVSLDEVGMRPQAYGRSGELTDFEQQLWGEFWEFANDPEKAAEMGIRAAHGEAVSVKVREGTSYNVTLRASGGLSIEPIETAPDDNQS